MKGKRLLLMQRTDNYLQERHRNYKAAIVVEESKTAYKLQWESGAIVWYLKSTFNDTFEIIEELEGDKV